MIRALGPSLSAFGVSPALDNPSVKLFANQMLLSSNDDWKTNANAASIVASGLAPTNDLESALLVRLDRRDARHRNQVFFQVCFHTFLMFGWRVFAGASSALVMVITSKYRSRPGALRTDKGNAFVTSDAELNGRRTKLPRMDSNHE